MKFKCPHCNTEYDLIASGKYECAVCHNTFEFELKQTPEPVPEPQKNICPFCKLEIPAEAQKCGHCGEWISGKAPANGSTYLILSFLFGNWGVAEFYVNNWLLGFAYFIINCILVAISFEEPGALVGIAIFWIFQFILSLFLAPSSGPEKPKRKATKGDIIYNIIIWLLGLAIIGGAVGYVFLKDI